MVNKYVVQIRDVGNTGDGQLYFTMDKCPGMDLEEILLCCRILSPHRAVSMAIQILRALTAAHHHGVIHCGLKPRKVMVFQNGGRETIRVLGLGNYSFSRPGFIENAKHSPPELLLGEKTGLYTDIYSVGVILYRCLTAQLPYRGSSAGEIVDDMKSHPATPPEVINPALREYPGLSGVISRALERNPDLRYPSARSFHDDLTRISHHPPTAVPHLRTLPARARPIPRRRPPVPANSSRSSSLFGFFLFALVLSLVIAAAPIFNNPGCRNDQGREVHIVAKKDEDIRKLRESALQAERSQQWEKAKRLYENLIRRIPESAEVCWRKGIMERHLGEYESALESLGRGLELDLKQGRNTEWKALLWIVETFNRIRNPGARERDLDVTAREILSTEPLNIQAVRDLLTLYLDRFDPQRKKWIGELDAISLYKRAMARGMRTPDGWYERYRERKKRWLQIYNDL